VSAIRYLWKHLDAAGLGAFGLFLIFAWAIFPVPDRKDLTAIEGPLSSYSVEADQSWFARNLERHRQVYVFFKVAGVDGRFWNDAVGPDNVRSVFPRLGVPIRLYRISHYPYRRINGDGEKTYGLKVDGSEVSSVDVAIGGDAVVAHRVLPVFGILAFIQAIRMWRKKARDASDRRSRAS
jgi:hypothetical protein